MNVKRAIIVVGAPRSGTSVISHVISRLGVNFGDPKKFVDAEQNKHNPIFFELQELNKINDEIFLYFNKNWTDFDWLPLVTDFSESVISLFYVRIENFIESEFGEAQLIGLKDPRFCFTLPIWIAVLEHIGYKLDFVFASRNPNTIFSSNSVINKAYSSSRNFRVVIESILAASYFLKGKKAVQVSYENILTQPQREIKLLSESLNLELALVDDAQSVIVPNLNHGVSSSKEVFFKCFDSLTATITDLADEYEKFREIAFALTFERDGQIDYYNQIISDRDDQVASLNQVVSERDQAVSELDGHITALYNSTSWRITGPMRFVSCQIKRIWRTVKFIVPAIKRRGGVRKTLKKAAQLYRREGFSGVKRGFMLVARMGQVIPAGGSNEYDRNDYSEWIRRYDTLTDEAAASMCSRIDTFANKPLISVVMPIYNPRPEWLRAAIESVRKQIYPHWELCIADDFSTNPAIRSLLEEFVKNDSRIKVVFREENGHISAASNSALKIASGDWVALMDHDDMLPEQALFWVADAINNNPDVQMIYSDEDKVDESGNRHSPYFKCDWNPDLFLSHNMFCHLGVYKRQLIEDVNGFRLGLEGAQDYDLVLRCIEKIDPNQIYHIPRVLYHWRVHSGSTAQSLDAKPYAELAAERALNEYFDRMGVDASVVSTAYGFRAQYRLPEKPPLVSLIIPTRNGLKLIRQCIESIINKTAYPNYEIIVVDNASDDPEVLTYFETIASEHKVKILKDDRPFNYSQLNNAAVKIAKGEIIGLINNDIEVIAPEWLSEMVSHALRPEVGAVGAKLLYPDDTLQHGGVVLGVGGVAGHSHKYFPRESNGYFSRMALISSFSAVTAACLVIKKSIYNQVGGLDELNLKVAFNDVDFCLRVREAGYRNIWTPYAELYHYESVSRGGEDTPEKQARFEQEVLYMKRQWGALLEIDPAYSPNLTLELEDFSYAWPPRTKSV